MESRKMVLLNLSAGRQWRCRQRPVDTLREQHGDTCIITRKTASGDLLQLRERRPALCDTRDGGVGGK